MSKCKHDMIRRQIRQLGEVIAANVARVRVDQDYGSGLEAIREAKPADSGS